MLTRVKDYREVGEGINGLLLQSGPTNGLPDRETLEREIARGTLFLQKEDWGLLLLRRRDRWDHLTFLLKKGRIPEDWKPERATVAELPFRREGEPMEAVAEKLEALGFRLILKRLRFTRKGHIGEAFPCEGVEGCEDTQSAYLLLRESFSPLTGCVPSREEWEGLKEKEQILTLPGGVLHYRFKGRTTELRHLAVAESCRRQGLGRALVGAYLNRCGGSLSRVWTGEGNLAAQRLYESFGYERDGLTSRVYYFENEKKEE